jgi:hypothetical protein
MSTSQSWKELKFPSKRYGHCWYLLTQKEYEGFRKRTEYHCSILPGLFQVSLFMFLPQRNNGVKIIE